MEGDAAGGMLIDLGGARGTAIDSGRSARGAHQHFVVPIRRDQDQRLWCSVLLNAPTTQRSVLPVGAVILMRTSHLLTIYELFPHGAKWLLLTLAGLSLGPTLRCAQAQTVHLVRLEVDADQDIYRFVPARVTARPGDIIRFKVSSGGPHNIAFDAGPLTAEGRAALNAAMPNRSGDLSGPVLERADAEYRLTVPALPPGHYGFFCTPHRAYDMRGELIVVR